MGPLSADMRMFPLESDQEASSFPLTKWKIPEPPEDLVLSREDGTFAGDIDLVVVPAMAFDARCNRLGHGRGYYGDGSIMISSCVMPVCVHVANAHPTMPCK